MESHGDRILLAQREEVRFEPTGPGPTQPVPAPAVPLLTLPLAGAAVATPELRGPFPRSLDLPILMYHRVQSVPSSDNDPQLRNLSVPPESFEEHAAMIAAMGAETVGLEDVQDFFFGRKPAPSRAVVLTFDDGYDNTYTRAFPVLRRLGMRATVFVVPSLVDQPGFLTWDQIRELSAVGWSIQSHTLSHHDLRTLSNTELARELRESRTQIERVTGRPVWYLCYPSGVYDRRVIDAASLAGYHGAVTVNYGTRLEQRQLFELPRVRVHGSDSAETVRAAMLPASWR